MRILLLTPGTGHFHCGSCLRDAALARQLTALGHDALVVPLYLPLVLEETEGLRALERIHLGGINMYLQQKLPALRHTPRILADLLDRPGLLRWASRRGRMTDSPDLGPLTLSTLRGELGRQAGEVRKLVRNLAEQQQPDVVVLSNAMLCGLVHSLKETLGAPVVSTLQGEEPFLDALPAPYSEQAWAELRRRADEIAAFVGVTRWYGERMAARLDLPAARLHIVHNGIDLEGVDTGAFPEPARPTVGFLARLCRDKGLPTLVEAWRELAGRGSVPGLRLSLCGALLPEDVEPFSELISGLAGDGFEDDVQVRLNVERAEKLEFLRGLSVLSVPATYGESFGLYVIEALASGVPFVQPDHAAFPELLSMTGGGRLCRPDDPRDLADELEAFLLDPRARRTCVERGRAKVIERFSAESMARGVAEICRLVVDG